jgi:hypothetical protein
VVACCPNLRELVDVALLHGPHVSELHKLTALTSLHVRYFLGIAPAFQQSLKGLAAVTQLQELSAYLHNSDLTVSSLLPLTSLTALTDLRCHIVGLGRVDLRSGCNLVSLQAQQALLCFREGHHVFGSTTDTDMAVAHGRTACQAQLHSTACCTCGAWVCGAYFMDKCAA